MEISNKISVKNVGKTQWPDGEWKDEPDEVRWSVIVPYRLSDTSQMFPAPQETFPDERKLINNYEYKCVILRSPILGQLCGYVIITEDHPALKGDVCNLDVHGGVTWNGGSIYEKYKNNNEIKERWIGFDCAHMCDRIPYDPVHNIITAKMTAEGKSFDYPSHKTYKNIAFVTKEIESLVEQLEKIRNA